MATTSNGVGVAIAAEESDERSPLLSFPVHGVESSGESSSSVSSGDDSDGEYVPWYLTPSSDIDSPPVDIERDASADAANSNKLDGSKVSASVIRVVVILLIGMFTSNADGSLVLATHPTIASEFNDLEDSSWLFTAFALAGAATQAMYGKLSDIYGRRWLLIVAYSLFAAGCAMVGASRSMWGVVLGRIISGSGGSAMSVVAALLITDLVPLRDVAAWQAGMNLASTIGRSLGGPVGGWLADTIGWRWSFLGQAPIFLGAMLLCAVYLPNDKPAPKAAKPGDDQASSPLARIDFLGATLLALFILAFLLPIEIGGSKVPWTHPVIYVLFGAAVVLGGLFAATEAWWAKEPIFPLELLRQRDIVASYVLMGCQTAAQLGLMFSVPLYFQVTQRASNTVAGAHLFPAVAGNAVGAIMAGVLIQRTGRYKYLVITSAICTFSSYLLLLLRWHGDTNIWESLYIIPSGFGTGMAQSAVFISLQAAVKSTHKGAATSGLFLTVSIGMILGLACVSAVMIGTMRWSLEARLLGMGIERAARKKIIEKAASNVDYIDQAEKTIAQAVVAAYVEGLSFSHGVSLICAALALVAGLVLREHKLS